MHPHAASMRMLHWGGHRVQGVLRGDGGKDDGETVGEGKLMTINQEQECMCVSCLVEVTLTDLWAVINQPQLEEGAKRLSKGTLNAC